MAFWTAPVAESIVACRLEELLADILVDGRWTERVSKGRFWWDAMPGQRLRPIGREEAV